eukprot:350136-Chlamydomonas_euryale.AAC.29
MAPRTARIPHQAAACNKPHAAASPPPNGGCTVRSVRTHPFCKVERRLHDEAHVDGVQAREAVERGARDVQDARHAARHHQLVARHLRHERHVTERRRRAGGDNALWLSKRRHGALEAVGRVERGGSAALAAMVAAVIAAVALTLLEAAAVHLCPPHCREDAQL